MGLYGAGAYGSGKYGALSDNQAGVTLATFGETGTGTAFTGIISSDFKYVSSFTLSEDASVSKLTVYLKSVGGSSQVMKGIIYSDSSGPSALLGTTSEVTVAAGAAAAWVDLPFSANVDLTPATFWLGLIFGPTSNNIEFATTSGAGRSKYHSDTYSDGPSDPFGVTSNDNLFMSIYATYGADPTGSTSSSQSNLIASQARRPHRGTSASHRRGGR